MKLGKGFLSVAILALALGANAQTKKATTSGGEAKHSSNKSLHDQFTGQGYGMAGCGLGSVVFGQKPGMIQVVAGTTNYYAGQTFAISSGTSNCGEAANAQEAARFIEVNKVAIENDLSRGQGESLAALSKVMKCRNSSFSNELRSEYNQNFPVGGASAGQIQAVAYKACQI